MVLLTSKNIHKTLCNNFENGGLKHVDTSSKIISLQCSGLGKLCDENFHEWKIITSRLINKYFGKSFKFYSCLSFDRKLLIKFPSFTLFNVAQEAPGNIGQEKLLFNVVLILLGRLCNCTGKNFVQCCPKVSRQHCTVKRPVQCCTRVSRQCYMGKNPIPCCLNTLGTTLNRKISCSMLS